MMMQTGLYQLQVAVDERLFAEGLEMPKVHSTGFVKGHGLWGRMASCGRLEIGLLLISRKLRQAD